MASDPDEEILQRIQARLHVLGLSERAATKLAKLSASAIRNMREGKSRSPRVDTLRRLAPALGVAPEWLAFGVERSSDQSAAPPKLHNDPVRVFESLSEQQQILALRLLSVVSEEEITDLPLIGKKLITDIIKYRKITHTTKN